MNLRPLVILAIIALALATGCATMTFKRGAGPGTAKADEDACRASSDSPESYSECLRAKGWMVRTPSSGGTEPAATEPAAAEPAAVADPVAAPTPPEPLPAPQPTPKTGGKPKTPPVDATPLAAPAASGTTSKAAPRPPAPSGKPSKPLEPTAHVTVQSWWKLGGTASGLDAAVAACVGELGESHRPNPAITDVTVAMRDCLRRAKWFPVGGTGGTGVK